MNNAIRHQSPQRPADRSGAGSLRGRDILVRAVVSAAVEVNTEKSPYPNDADTAFLTRAATTPGTLGTHPALAQTAVADFVTGLAPSSAGASLIASGLIVEPSSYGSVVVPGITAHPALAFVADASAIPYAGFSFAGGTLSPHKLAGVVAYTRALSKHSQFEDAVRLTLGEAVGLSIDAALFSSAAASVSAPAGLLNGVTPITAEAGGMDDAMLADLTALGGAVAPVAGEQITFVASPRQAVKIALRGPQPFPYELRSSAALADGTVVAVATRLLATMFDPTPEFMVSTEGLIHMSDTPLPIVASGVTADPVRGLYQTDCVAIRVILKASWVKRAAGGVAVINGASW